MKRFVLLLATLLFSAFALAAVNINTATKEELDALPGIGPVKAQAIVDYRAKNGPFKTPEDIMKVPGIKEGTFGPLKDKISVTGASTPVAQDNKAAKESKAPPPAAPAKAPEAKGAPAAAPPAPAPAKTEAKKDDKAMKADEKKSATAKEEKAAPKEDKAMKAADDKKAKADEKAAKKKAKEDEAAKNKAAKDGDKEKKASKSDKDSKVSADEKAKK